MPLLRSLTAISVAGLMACGESVPEIVEPEVGTLRVIVSTGGYSRDLDGYTALVDGTDRGRLEPRDTLVLDLVDAGSHRVALGNVAGNCSAQARTVTVPRADVVDAKMEVFCDSTLHGVIVFIQSEGTGPEGLTAGMVRPDGQGVQSLGKAHQVSVSRDGRFLAVTRHRPAYSIYRVKPDGNGLLDLTPDTDADHTSAWSPDGSRIAFISSRTGELQLYTMHSDGSNQRRLTDSDRQEHGPRWSPDGLRIMISRMAVSGDATEIVIVQADGSGEEVLPRPAGVSDEPIDWSPDGARILVNSTEDGSNHIWLMNADGSARRNLTPGSDSYFGSARWSPSGDEIVVDRYPAEGGTEILRLVLATSELIPVLTVAAPRWARVMEWVP